MYSNTMPCFFTNTTSRKSLTMKGGIRLAGCGQMRGEVVDPVGDVRIVAHHRRDSAVRVVTQELDVLGMAARIGHPDAALLDPILLRLRLGRGCADVVEHERGHD